MNLLWIFIKPLIPSTSALFLYAGIALVLSGSFVGWSIHQYNKGYSAAIYAIARKDKEAIDAADEASKVVSQCFDSGRTWDDIGGLCRP